MDRLGPDLLAKLLDEHRPALLLYARQWCDDTADDVVQEAFWELIRQHKLPDAMVPWLYRVVRNRAISAGRSARRRGKYETAAAERRAEWFWPDPGAGVDAQAAQRALEALPVAQREVVVARLWSGMSFEEIAALTGTSLTTAHRTYYAALQVIRQTLNSDAICAKKDDQ